MRTKKEVIEEMMKMQNPATLLNDGKYYILAEILLDIRDLLANPLKEDE